MTERMELEEKNNKRVVGSMLHVLKNVKKNISVSEKMGKSQYKWKL